ncbi:protein DCL, chloroplastic [Magnolia sinica]|uniref:protein DCL, chloroplastic n=1 Tax=Magnolia sinica TaxID=86752 RepID=UPI002659B69B|nr:protein DCL, chloroplastic [Magnolia sinica]
MASICSSSPPLLVRTNPVSPRSLFSISFSAQPPVRFRVLRAEGLDQGGGPKSQEAGDPSLLRKPSISSSTGFSQISDVDEEPAAGDGGKKDDEWVDWEDQILEETVPLVGFVRMILHSGKYESGDRLSPEHEKTILERILPHHPEFEKKIGCGIDYITVGYHPDFEDSRCLFIVRKDGEVVDFSYWKCIKGLIKKNYPLYADSFILRHFRRRRRTE